MVERSRTSKDSMIEDHLDEDAPFLSSARDMCLNCHVCPFILILLSTTLDTRIECGGN
jgi:hypothetical protein